MDTIAREAEYTSGVYPKRDVAIVRGQGARVWDAEGNEYIDCVSGHGVGIVGHCHPRVVEAIREQAGRLITCPEIFYNDVRGQLLQRLIDVAPEGFERAYLCNSGAESVEAALKLARLSTGRPGFVAAMRGFHGRTMGALSATWEPKYRKPYMPLVPGFAHVPYNNIEAMAEAVDENTAAVLLEPIQGEGGVNPAEPGYLEAVRDICDDAGALLIIDEVQTGFGRTGKLFAIEHAGVRADLICLAKAIAGGVPMGAVLIGEAIEGLKPGVHGSTFGGNPLACAAALATLEVIRDEDLVGEAARKGGRALERLRNIDARLIRDVRGMGLMLGVEIRLRSTPYLKALMEENILALPAGSTVIRLLPPLVISDEDLDHVLDVLERLLIEEVG
jgi:acetylornithine/LysW-gamma-L-lysine aminotransferase